MRLLLAILVIFAASQEVLPEDQETDISFTATFDQSEQRYVLWQPSEVSTLDGCGVLIALHGHGSDRWQFIQNPRDECRAVRDMARKHNMAIIAPDYRATTSWMGPAAESDMLQIVEEYRKQHKPDRVLLVGGSMGATSALTFAALHPETIDGVVAMNGIANHVEYTNFQEAITSSFGGDKQTKPEEYQKRSAEYRADILTMPVAFTIGGADVMTPPQSIIRLADNLKKLGRNVLLIQQPSGGHETNYEDACEAIAYVIMQTTSENDSNEKQDTTPVSPAE